jgi:hypothetical protein
MRKVLSILSAIMVLLTYPYANADTMQTEPIEKPVFKAKDSWTFRINDRSMNGETKERHVAISIVRSNANSILQSAKATDSSMPPIEKLLGADLSLSTSISGKEVIVHKPFNFPMESGKKWTISYLRENPNKKVKTHWTELRYEATGWEEVSVPAGTFRAFKVEAEGTWRDEFNPTPLTAGSATQMDKDGSVIVVKNQRPMTPAPLTGKIFRSYWFVPAVKREIKNVEEQFNSDGSLATRSTWELESFSLDGQGSKK